MDARALKEFLEAVRAGKVSVDEAVRRIADLPVQHVADFAQLDGERALRQGVPEVVLRKAPVLREADALVVCAGMEGALPSVVGGLVARPVIAVPTSVGYGASFGGLAALLAMLNSCAANVSVVNIDNGFSAGFSAALIARQSHRARK